jgi:hypothetical protein
MNFFYFLKMIFDINISKWSQNIKKLFEEICFLKKLRERGLYFFSKHTHKGLVSRVRPEWRLIFSYYFDVLLSKIIFLKKYILF